MRQWKHKIEVEIPEDAQGAACVLRNVLSSLPGSFRSLAYGFESLNDYIDMLDDDALDEDSFNDVLREIYAWADRFGLWLSFDGI